jgi:hypothetical protein
MYRLLKASAVGFLSVLFVVLAGLLASATNGCHYAASNYLASGDSVSFGYNPLLERQGVKPDVFVSFPQLASALF